MGIHGERRFLIRPAVGSPSREPKEVRKGDPEGETLNRAAEEQGRAAADLWKGEDVLLRRQIDKLEQPARDMMLLALAEEFPGEIHAAATQVLLELVDPAVKKAWMRMAKHVGFGYAPW